MKKWGIIGLAVATAVVSASMASAATKYTLIVNGQVAAAEVKNIDGTTYVPLRVAAELLGSEVNFDAATKTITIVSAGKNPPVPKDQTEAEACTEAKEQEMTAEEIADSLLNGTYNLDRFELSEKETGRCLYDPFSDSVDDVENSFFERIEAEIN